VTWFWDFIKNFSKIFNDFFLTFQGSFDEELMTIWQKK